MLHFLRRYSDIDTPWELGNFPFESVGGNRFILRLDRWRKRRDRWFGGIRTSYEQLEIPVENSFNADCHELMSKALLRRHKENAMFTELVRGAHEDIHARVVEFYDKKFGKIPGDPAGEL